MRYIELYDTWKQTETYLIQHNNNGKCNIIICNICQEENKRIAVLETHTHIDYYRLTLVRSDIESNINYYYYYYNLSNRTTSWLSSMAILLKLFFWDFFEIFFDIDLIKENISKVFELSNNFISVLLLLLFYP